MCAKHLPYVHSTARRSLAWLIEAWNVYVCAGDSGRADNHSRQHNTRYIVSITTGSSFDNKNEMVDTFEVHTEFLKKLAILREFSGYKTSRVYFTAAKNRATTDSNSVIPPKLLWVQLEKGAETSHMFQPLYSKFQPFHTSVKYISTVPIRNL